MPTRYLSLNKIKPSFFPGIAWFIISVILLTLPGSAFPKENWFSKIWLDKWVHIGLFALLVFLWCWAILRYKIDVSKLRKSFITIALVALAYGIVMEFVQKYFVVNRSFDGGDILADAVGCFAGWFFSTRRYIKK